MPAFLLLWISFAAALWFHRAPGLSFFDGSEFALHIRSGGIAHAPGYPLYLLMGRFLNIFTKDPFLAQHLINQLSLAVASVALIAALRIEARINKKPLELKAAWLVLLLFYSSYFVKLYALLPEVFLMNIALFALIGFALCSWYASPIEARRPWWCWRLFSLFLVYGLGVAHHHTLALTLPAFAVLAHWKKSITTRSWPSILVGFALGAAPLIYLFYAVGPDTDHTYFFVENFGDFWFVLLRKAYGTFQLARTTSSAAPDSAFSSLALGVARNFGYLGVILFAPVVFLAWTHLSEKAAWTRCKDFFRARPALVFASFSLITFSAVFGAGATLDVASIVNRNTLWRFATIPCFLLLYWAYFCFQWILQKGGEKFFYVIILMILALNLSGWKSLVPLKNDQMRWQFDQIYSRISGPSENCVIFGTSDTLMYSLQYYNEAMAPHRCYVFSLAQFSGHFRARREEALVAQMLGEDHVERYRRLGLTEPQLVQILFRELLKHQFRIYLVHPRDVQYLGGSGLGIRLMGSAIEIVDTAGDRRSELENEWAGYLSWVEARTTELERGTESDPPGLDEYAELAWLQNLFGYPRIYARGKSTADGEELRLRSLRLKSRLARLFHDEPSDFFADRF